LAREERYRELDWLKLPAEQLHNGYFAQDKKGVFKDTRGDTQADDEVYNLIMKDKERLLSLDEPLRFIFSHSALREGWDNPNVFQICTLNEV
jgi:type III restriction enzyme